ncbi:MAG: 5'-methylthioadenosine/adenosylhomocysteine nucleosidase [Clostridiales bacterium]|nr:5'-methylthioadenosine/adenosylhomocysteine nucleosidase [Clostridiales bacterium]
MIGIIVAMESELRPFLELPHTIEKKGSKPFYLIKIANKQVVVVLSGIGKVNASYAATLLIHLYKPKLIISTGVSGGLGILNVLDIVVATKTCQHDVDTSALGDPVGFVSTVNCIYFPTDEKISNEFAKTLNAHMGVLACGDCFVADNKLRDSIANNFDAIACDMESGAIGQVCHIENVPYVALRCISDGAGDNAELTYSQVLQKASALLFEGVIKVIKRMD